MIASCIMVVISFLNTVFSMLIISFAIPQTYSYTDDPIKYLQLDECCQRRLGREIHELFPNTLPISKETYDYNSASYLNTTKYLYEFHHPLIDNDYYATLHLKAEWRLSDEDYGKEVDRVKKLCSCEAAEDGEDWKTITLKEYESYYNVLERSFSYNNATKTVRYELYWEY